MNNLDVYANGFENEFTTTACIKQTTTDIIKNLNNIVVLLLLYLPGRGDIIVVWSLAGAALKSKRGGGRFAYTWI